MAGGFKSPAFWLGLSSEPAVTQGGFRTPLPLFPAGGTAAVTQGGYRGLLGLWGGGYAAGEALQGDVAREPGGHVRYFGPGSIEYEEEEEEELILMFVAAHQERMQ